MNLSLGVVQATQRKLGYPVFVNGNYNLNLVGVRSKNRIANDFDDFIVIYYHINNHWHFHQFPATLDPGLTYLQTPFSPQVANEGAFIIAEGFHRGLWSLGRFRNRHALLQVGIVRGYRDRNWDRVLDLDPRTITQGHYGILLHPHFQGVKLARNVWNSSAGCIVPQSDDDFDLIIRLCRQSANIYGNRFSFTVLREEDLVS